MNPQNDDLIRKRARKIVDAGDVPKATLQESITLNEKVDALIEEVKKKDLLEYDLQIDEEARIHLKGDKGDTGEKGEKGDTGACYRFTAFANANQPAILTILNNGYTAGNVELLNLQIDSVRGGTAVANTADVLPYFTLALLEGYNPSVNGEVITEKKFDSTNTLNSYVKLYKNVDVGYFYSRTGNLATNSLMWRNVPQTSRIATPMFTPQKQVIFKSSGTENDLVVREGSGIALLQPDAGAYGSSYYIDVVFTQESTTASAVYPTVGNVDLSVTYGPTGADYTGTLVQPAITNVLTGVQYGADGTEFTGTATSGGETSYVF